MERNAGEIDFITEYTRSQLVRWADGCIRDGCIPTVLLDGTYTHVYLDCARKKGWVTKADPPKLTSKGFKAAASFLRR